MPHTVESEYIQDLFLPHRAKAEATRERRAWFLLTFVLVTWCFSPLLCVVGSLIGTGADMLQGEPRHLVVLGVVLTFSMGLLFLWMCSNSERPRPSDDADDE